MAEFPLVISPSEFASQLSHIESDICIVDLSEEANYQNGHIPGARYLPYRALISGQPPAPGKLPPTEQLVEVFTYLNHTPDTHYIVYDDEGGGWAGRFIWTLDVIGHTKYSYIDGGLLAWRGEGLPLESGFKEVEKPDSKVSINVSSSAIASLDEIINGLGKNQFVVWDARSPEEYMGLRASAAKAGHIPGAINAEWTSLMDQQNNLRIRSDAKQHLEALGINGSLPIITHCQTHHRSGFTYLVAKSLGYDVKAYDGSWSEWGNHPETPVEK